MSPDERKSLIEKIDGLSPEQRKRVEGYVDALIETRKPDSGQGRVEEEEGSGEEREEEPEYLDLSFRGALKHLQDQYTSVELQHRIQEEWRKQATNS